MSEDSAEKPSEEALVRFEYDLISSSRSDASKQLWTDCKNAQTLDQELAIIDRALRAERERVIEECAKVAEQTKPDCLNSCQKAAKRIRGLRGKGS